ncbi:C2 domain containing protein [Tanacetum coccineum]|uniref:C2 domain containing protein n=1 Tax=Tanacetum coccineum TaxID=301880 RepID=A0ABQ5DT27_9ASTR
MGKIWVEICLISARGLTRTSSLWKLQWFAVGWIDPNNKYCTKVDASGNANPKWKTKFSALVDDSDSKCDDLALNVEVYSRDPVFLKERLQGTAIVGLKEFLDKHKNNSEESRHVEEVGSFQLRKKNSNKPQGFVDVSVNISQETDEGNSYEGDEVGIKLKIRDHSVDLASQSGHSENHLQTTYPTMLPPGQPSYHQPRAPVPLNYPLAGGSNHQPSHAPSIRPNYHQPQTQPPPQPQYNVGYMPPSSIGNLPASYINMPSSSGPRPGPRAGPGFAMGLGAGALAAGAAIYGEDFRCVWRFRQSGSCSPGIGSQCRPIF